jgi:ketosteroid isomerase-like protein
MSTIALGLVLALAGILPPGPAASGAPAVEERAIRAVLDEFDAALSARNVDQVMATLAPSDDLTLFLPVPYVPMRIDGATTARKSFEIFFQGLPRQSTLVVSSHGGVVQVHGDSASAYSYQVLFLGTGGLPTRLICRTTTILLKREGRWRIVHLHSAAMPDIADFIAK